MTKTPTPEQHAEQSAVFSRGRNGTTAELRGDVPRSTLDVLDAVSIARGYPSRMALVNEILGRNAILRELNQEYAAMARRRIDSDVGHVARQIALEA